MATKQQQQQQVQASPNLELYNRVRSVPDHAKKSFNNGSFSGTDVNPMFRIKVLTEQFGPAGIGWYTEVVEHWEENIEGEILTNVAINLFIKVNGEWSKPIYGVGGNKALQQFRDKKKISDEAYKMAYTDAISVACKALGIAADVYFEKDSTSKYYQYYEQQQQQVQAPQAVAQANAPAPAPAPAPSEANEVQQAIAEINAAKDAASLGAAWNKWGPRFSSNAEVVKAVMKHPCNPSNGRSR